MRFPAAFGLVVTLLVSQGSVHGAEKNWPLPATTAESAGFSAARLEVLHGNLQRLVDEGKYSGYVVLLARDGKVVDWRAGGLAERGQKKPMQQDSIVRIYSMSKLITTVAVLSLVEDGRLKLTDPIRSFLPALGKPTVFAGGTADAPVLAPAKRPVTVLDLLTHTSGYCYGETWSADAPMVQLYQRAKLYDAHGLDEFVTRVATLPLHDQPGERFRYGISVDLLGAIVEKVSGQKFEEFLQQRIFTPLAMRDTGFSVPPEKRARLARVYARRADGTLEEDAMRNTGLGEARSFPSGGGGLFSTAADYVRFAQMLLNNGELDGTRILSRKTVELMTANHLVGLADPHPFGAKSQGFGLGVRVMTDLGQSPVLGSVGCYGWDGAASTLVQIDPRERTVALLLLQHVPFNQDDIFALFENGYYSALEK